MDEDAITPVGGTAVVVVPGVGDDGPGDTVGSMTGALLREMGPGARAIPYTRTIVVPRRSGSRGGPAVHDVRCALLMRPGRPEPLMVYEMHWADLSRFPNRVLRFVLTLYGMLFQVGVFGIEAARALPGWKWPKHLVRFFSWMTVVAIVGLTAGAAILGVEFSAAVRFTSAGQGIAIAAVTLVVAVALAAYGDSFMRARGWRFSRAVPLGRNLSLGRPLVGLGLIALAVGIAPLAVRADRGGSMAFAVHSVLWFAVRWVLPVAWAIVGVVAILISLTQLALPPQADGDPDADRRFRATRTAVLSVVVGGLGIALLGALLVAAALGVIVRLLGTERHIPSDVSNDMPGHPTLFTDYAGAVFEHSLQPLGVALLCALGLLALVLLAGFRYASALAQAGATPAPPGRCWRALGAAVVPGAVAVVLLGYDAPASDLIAVILLAVTAGLVGFAWAGHFGPDARRRPIARGFDGLLAYLASFEHVLMLVAALMTAAVALLLATPLSPSAGARLSDFSDAILTPFTAIGGGGGDTFGSTAQISATVIVLVAVVALLRTRLAAVARGLDVAYDVATYLRVTHGRPSESDRVEPPRRRVLRRYAALLLHIDRVQRPERILIVAHSQGSMYSLALLFRDVCRDAADTRDESGWTVAASPSPSAPAPRGIPADPFPRLRARVSLMTAGCPVLQTYSPNFPGQYEWPGVPATAQARLRAGGVEAWRNVYRSGDYFGRGLWSGTCAPEFASGPLSERCIGPGHHTGYWSDPRFAREVLALL